MRIPTYVINLKNRTERLNHIRNQFEGREEFDVKIKEAVKHNNGALGLWESITGILKEVKDNISEYVLIVEDDHKFTESYSSELLFECIREARKREADVLIGGVSWIDCVFEVTDSLIWVDTFNGTQFIIIYRNFLNKLLAINFTEHDTADRIISSQSIRKFLINPYISVQESFGYSDVTENNNMEGQVEALFDWSSKMVKYLLGKSRSYTYDGFDISMNDLDDFYLPTYIINFSDRIDRITHIQKEFENRNEYQLTIIKAFQDEIRDAVLWKNFQKIIRMGIEREDDILIICLDDHVFTSNYNKEFLFKNILEADLQNVDILSGGSVGDFQYCFPVSEDRFWVSHLSTTQFIVIYNRFYSKILETSFDNKVPFSTFLSKLSTNKMIIYPYLSSKKIFAHFDNMPKDLNLAEMLKTNMIKSSEQLIRIKDAFAKYRNFDYLRSRSI